MLGYLTLPNEVKPNDKPFQKPYWEKNKKHSSHRAIAIIGPVGFYSLAIAKKKAQSSLSFIPSGNLLQFATENNHLQLIYVFKMVLFHSFLYVYQRVYPPFIPI